MTNIFETTITDDMVEDAVVASLKKWFSTELRVIEEELGLAVGHYLRPRTWEIHSDFDRFPEEQLPAVIVISTGTSDTPRKDGGKQVRATFDIAVACFASSTEIDKSRRYAYRLGGAARAVMLHRQSLDGGIDGRIRGVDWTSSRNGEMPVEGDRTVWATRQTFTVEVANAVTVSAGPSEPDADPPPDGQPLPEWGVIPDREHITFELIKEPIE